MGRGRTSATAVAPTIAIGRQEAGLLGERRTLVAAHGGIYTHRAAPHAKPNIPAMVLSLTTVDVAGGTLRVPQSPDGCFLNTR